MKPDSCQACPCCDQLLSLASELLWNTLLFSGENALVLTGAATSQLLLVSERARLHLFLLQLDANKRGTGSSKLRLSDGRHVSGRLAPPMSIRRQLDTKTAQLVQTALARLSRMSNVGDQVVILSMLPWIELGNLSTRATAVRSVSKLAQRGDSLVVNALLGRLRDPVLGGLAMEAAIESLQCVASRGDPHVLARVYALLEESRAHARCAALHALPSVVEHGDETAIQKVIARADDKDQGIRETALRALGKIARPDAHDAFSCIIRGLRDESVYVRQAALEALPS